MNIFKISGFQTIKSQFVCEFRKLIGFSCKKDFFSSSELLSHTHFKKVIFCLVVPPRTPYPLTGWTTKAPFINALKQNG